MSAKQFRSITTALAVCAALFASSSGRADDDTALFSVNVPPNVLLIMDNSGSMNEMVWHPGYDPSATYSCNTGNGGFTSEQSYGSGTSRTLSRCTRTRTIYLDPSVIAAGNSVRYSAGYLNWIFSLPDGDPRLTELAATNDGTYSSCLLAQGYTTYNRYQRARVTAAKDVLREVICNVNQAGKVRFGIAEFRLSGGSSDPNGGFVRVPIKDFDAPTYTLPLTSGTLTGTHQQQIDAAINALEGESWTPLSETLFTNYTYFMSRNAADRPAGVNGATFPGYVYRTNPTGNYGSYTTTASLIPEDPVQFDCQKNFIVLITDGEPTKDDFDNSNSGDNTAQGYGSFTGLIGDYNADGETEVGGASCMGGSECTLYLDDIAKFMQNNDFRPDRPGTQVIDLYTVGFTTTPAANDLLSRAAAQGNGLFYSSNSAEELANAIVGAISDIIEKSQSFTAATVPATRTADGGNIYTSLFLPRLDDPYWEGHLKLFNITQNGDILDANGDCALVSETAGECKAGAISQTAVPYWDAGEEIPDPDSRTLYTSIPSGTTVNRTAFNTSALGVAALGDPAVATDDLVLADRALYPLQTATTAEILADQIIDNVRGCEFGTGAGTACVRRPWVLGDIFHSNPLVVSDPRTFVAEASYRAFGTTYARRDKAVYAGANAGFLHAFEAGTWMPSPPTGNPRYDRGDGGELFGFMPWTARRNIRHLPKDGGSRDYYFVDGSPVAADLWFRSSDTQLPSAKAADGSEWKTVLAGGMRQGGSSYYALDITDPEAAGYPGYLWEFPRETAAASIKNYMGETWGTPILTRVKVVISGNVYERSVAIVTGGYHVTGDPNDALNYNAAATAGRSIFIIDVKTGEILGQKKFDAAAPVTDPQSRMEYAIAATPAVYDLDGDDFADVVYVGDLGGNVWKWVISHDPVNGNSGEDPVTSSGSVTQPGWDFSLFFKATPTAASSLGVTLGGVTYYKSIFFPPAATYANGDLWLSFATGERTTLKRQGDTTSDAENNRFYSLIDADPLERAATTTISESALYDATTDTGCPTMGSYSGYYFKAADGEKFVTNVDIFAYQVIAASYTPTDTTNPCSSAGEGKLYVFRADCGEGFFTDASGNSARTLDIGAGMPTDPRVTVSPGGDGTSDGDPEVRVVTTQQDGEVENIEGPPIDPDKLGQLYWREIFQ